MLEDERLLSIDAEELLSRRTLKAGLPRDREVAKLSPGSAGFLHRIYKALERDGHAKGPDTAHKRYF